MSTTRGARTRGTARLVKALLAVGSADCAIPAGLVPVLPPEVHGDAAAVGGAAAAAVEGRRWMLPGPRCVATATGSVCR
jgi:hypothetical protein